MRKVLLLLPVLSLLLVSPSAIAKENNKKVELSALSATEVRNKDYFAFNERVENFHPLKLQHS